VKKKERLTEARIWILGLDPLAPVLAKEHVRRERALGCLGVFLTSTAAGNFLCFLDRLACLRALNMRIDGSKVRKVQVWGGRGVTKLTFDFVASLGI
jgi:hypothetical protein